MRLSPTAKNWKIQAAMMTPSRKLLFSSYSWPWIFVTGRNSSFCILIRVSTVNLNIEGLVRLLLLRAVILTLSSSSSSDWSTRLVSGNLADVFSCDPPPSGLFYHKYNKAFIFKVVNTKHSPYQSLEVDVIVSKNGPKRVQEQTLINSLENEL